MPPDHHDQRTFSESLAEITAQLRGYPSINRLRRRRTGRPFQLCQSCGAQILPAALYLLVSGKEVLVDSSSERVALWWHTSQQLQKFGLTLTGDRFLVQPKGE